MTRSCGRVVVVLAVVLGASGCGQNKFQQEVETEKVAVKLARHMAAGEYEVITTDELKTLLDKRPEMVLVDAMPLEATPDVHRAAVVGVVVICSGAVVLIVVIHQIIRASSSASASV